MQHSKEQLLAIIAGMAPPPPDDYHNPELVKLPLTLKDIATWWYKENINPVEFEFSNHLFNPFESLNYYLGSEFHVDYMKERGVYDEAGKAYHQYMLERQTQWRAAYANDLYNKLFNNG